jgi:hypothetical protein
MMVDEFVLAAREQNWRAPVVGGTADGLSARDFPAATLVQGMQVEFEHTDDPWLALRITMDHLAERGDYYDLLPCVEGAPYESAQEPTRALRARAHRNPVGRRRNATPEQAGCVLAKHAWDRDTVECGPNAPTTAQAAQILANKRWTLPPDIRKQKARLLR